MLTPSRLLAALFATLGLGFSASAKTADGKSLVVFIAGRPSHGPGEHEHNAGVQLLAKCLAQGAPQVLSQITLGGAWPSAEVLAQADTIVLYSDGGGGHVALQDERLASLAREMNRGAGLVCLHYAVEPAYEKTGWPEPQNGPDGKPLKQEIPPGRGSKGKGAAEFLDWLGGYFEQYWSVNPHWTANFKELPKHPISNGVLPFSTTDEWYYHMRFKRGLEGVTPILSDLPPPETMNRGEGPHAGNPDVKREVLEEKKPQHVAWAVERPDGGRGFGFTGGHFHKGWANDEQRKLILNAVLWTAKVEVPANGVESKITEADLAANLDPKTPRNPKPAPAAAPAPSADANAKPVFTSALVSRQPVEIKADLKGARELYLAVTDGGDGFVADWADWMEPTLIKADGSKIKLTDLKPKSVKVGFGQFGVNKNARGAELKVGGQPVAFGFGAHAPSIVGFDLPDGVVAFEGRGGVDNGGTDQGNGATVKFQVFTANPGNAPLASKQDAGTAADRRGLEAAQKNMSTFTTPKGLRATLFAAEPQIQNPTNLEIDQRGRVWAVECVNYRKYADLRPAGDRVVILEDSNGDGLADQETTFFQDPRLTNPLGICVLPGAGGAKAGTQVLVSAAPNLWLLTDTDGDDKADKAEVILKVGGSFNHDHQLHALSFGMDGKLYFNFGNEGQKLTWPDGSPVVDVAGNPVNNSGKPYRQGMVFRAELADGKLKNIETLGWNFRNNYEVAVDSFGTMWQSDNDDDGNKGVRINYVMDYGNFGYTDEMTGAGWRTPRTNMEAEIPLRHWYQNDPGSIPNLLQTGSGSPTGILVNEGTALGAQFTNQLIHCDAGPRTVRAYPVENDGAGYKATMVDLLTSTDNWYRPSDVAIAPDGSLYVADWYDPGVGGHAMGDHDAGQIMGRIYRVAAEGAKPQVPAVDFSTAAGATAALVSPNKVTQYIAWQKLRALGVAAEPELLKLWKNENPRFRARALGLLTLLPNSATKYLAAGFKDADAHVRIAAIRLTRSLAKTGGLDTTPLEEDRALVGALLKDTPQVRREIALSLNGAKDIAQLWVALARQHDGKDRWYLEALGIGARGNEDACFDAWLAAVGDQWNTPAGRDIIWRLRSAKAAGYLAKLIEDRNIAEAEKPRYLRAFDFLPEAPEKTRVLTELASLGDGSNALAAEALTRLKNVDLKTDAAVKAALDKALTASRGTPRFIEIVSDFRISGQGAAVLDAAVRNLQSPQAADALKLLIGDPAFGTILDAALAGPQADAVVTLLGSSSEPRVINLLTNLAVRPNAPALRRVAAVQALARSQTGAQAILQMAKNGELPAELKGPATTALNLVQYPALKADIVALFPAPAALGGQSLAPIAELVKIKGDLVRGKAIYERAESSCVTCHRVNDKGVDFAPALSEIGSKLPKEALFDAIINPNTGISMGFETTLLETKTGTVAIGIVRSETNDDLVLALPGGAAAKFGKREIAKREKLPTSLMPSGLNQALTQQDLVDLVEYLASLKKS